MKMRRIGVLTSGGDAPGMNAAIVSVARSAAAMGMPLIGIKCGYNGLLRRNSNISDDIVELNLETALDIASRPGTYLKTARCDEFRDPAWRKVAVQTIHDLEIDGLVIIGGDGSFQGAMRLCEMGVPCIGIPGTIDNDLPYTEMTLGYETAVDVCTDAVRSVRATSRSHDRPGVVEVMGRHCGDIALKTACATGAEILLVPEVEWSIEETAERLGSLYRKGNHRATIIVAEGCWESMQHTMNWQKFLNDHGKPCHADEPMSAVRFASVMKRMCGNVEARATVIGYTQRGAYPVPADSAFAFEAGHLAVTLLSRGISNQVIGIRNGQVFYMPIDEALQEKKIFRKDLYDLVNSL